MSTTASTSPSTDPAWEHLENIGVCCKATPTGIAYHDAESLASLARLNAIRARYGEKNVATGNGKPVAPGRIGVYLRASR